MLFKDEEYLTLLATHKELQTLLAKDNRVSYIRDVQVPDTNYHQLSLFIEAPNRNIIEMQYINHKFDISLIGLHPEFLSAYCYRSKVFEDIEYPYLIKNIFDWVRNNDIISENLKYDQLQYLLSDLNII